jgi:hypothetical protein
MLGVPQDLGGLRGTNLSVTHRSAKVWCGGHPHPQFHHPAYRPVGVTDPHSDLLDGRPDL